MSRKKKKKIMPTYTSDQKRDAVARMASGSISQKALARELGLAVSTLHYWRAAAAANAAPAPAAPAIAEPSKDRRRRFSDSVKRDAIFRLDTGRTTLSALADELKVGTRMLCRWQKMVHADQISARVTTAPTAPKATAAVAAQPTVDELYALVGRLTVDNQALRRRLEEK